MVCAGDQAKTNNDEGSTKPVAQKNYKNPVIDFSVPDPTAIRTDDGTYYLYGTEDTRGIPIYSSKDMVTWRLQGTAFTDQTRPKLPEGGGSLWAPEIRKIKGKYVLFYSLAIWGQEWVSTVGYAVADTPKGPFTDRGKVFDSHDVNVQNSIDQFFYEENGKYYMIWGSFSGLYIIELSIDDNLNITYKLDTKQRVAGNAYEAVNVWKRDGYYYLFASIGSCCEGAKSTYQTVVARSKNLYGPYVNKEGKKMLDNAHEIVLHKGNGFVGTGHNSILQEDDKGQTWMLYHAFQLSEIEKNRKVLLDRVLWDKDGWPYVDKLEPSTYAPKPVIR